MRSLSMLVPIHLLLACADDGSRNFGDCSLRGTVVYAGSTIPVAGVLVQLGDVSDTTESDGAFMLSQAVLGDGPLKAVKDGFDPFSRTLTRCEPLTLEMTSGQYSHTLSGTVQNVAGIPLAGAAIAVLNLDGSDSRLLDTSDAQSRYQITAVPQGTRSVRFAHPNACSSVLEIAIASFDKVFDARIACDEDADAYHALKSGGTDCDDANPEVHPGANETCGNAIDENCSGQDLGCNEEDNDGDGWPAGEDCNDQAATTYPSALEICGDRIDQDCNGADLSCRDADQDVDGFTENQGDCNDDDSAISPNATDVCGDGVDQDCSGSDRSCSTVDQDGDGFSPNAGDCNDQDLAINPNAKEVCDGQDNDCRDGIDRMVCRGDVETIPDPTSLGPLAITNEAPLEYAICTGTSLEQQRSGFGVLNSIPVACTGVAWDGSTYYVITHDGSCAFQICDVSPTLTVGNCAPLDALTLNYQNLCTQQNLYFTTPLSYSGANCIYTVSVVRPSTEFLESPRAVRINCTTGQFLEEMPQSQCSGGIRQWLGGCIQEGTTVWGTQTYLNVTSNLGTEPSVPGQPDWYGQTISAEIEDASPLLSLGAGSYIIHISKLSASPYLYYYEGFPGGIVTRRLATMDITQ